MSEKDLNRQATEADLENVSGGAIVDYGTFKGKKAKVGKISAVSNTKGGAETDELHMMAYLYMQEHPDATISDGTKSRIDKLMQESNWTFK